MPSEDDHSLAARLAAEAGEVLLRLRAERGFADGRALKDAGDQASHEYLMAALAQYRPDDAVLSEEGKDDKVRLRSDRVWIVDPLDGTREFSEEGRSDWAVHVALWEKDRLTAGAVALPAQGVTLSTGEPPAPAERSSDAIRIVVSRTRPPQIVHDLTAKLEAAGHRVELVPMGSAGAKIAAVLTGDVDVYVHAGGQYEWDSAAPAAVALAAGAHASRIDGSPLVYNEEDPYLPDILVSHPSLAQVILNGLN
ncbi:3'(2'),5'-bisphosphate nucleotidase CysQ [Actinocorallia populi]|uniref:3'(2'),5'-bisphosphate nucleotidase CysQ n=1 Tax=Actinocorallia populi TaxID=2079200 RepID=UPI000D089A78|nr:3'(2'),5'-bisphosphate nucleotidase CysQ [Actinocorallia populi]